MEYSDYYPDGMRFWTSTSNSATLPYRYNGKELEAMNGLNEYDYGARRRETGIPVWTTMDPLAEKYYGVSPYVYCAGNPIYYVDPDGMKVIYNQNESGYSSYTISGDDVFAYLGYLQDIQNGTGSMDNMLAACAAAAKGKGNGNAGTNLPTTEPEVTAIGFGPRPKETLSQSPMATRFEFWLNAKSNNFMEGALKMVASMAYAALNSPAITFTGMTWGGAYVDSPNGRILPLVDVATFGIGASIDKILPLAKATDGIQGFNAFMKANKSNFTGKEWQTEASKAFKMSRIQVQSIKDYDKSKSVLDIVSSMQTQYSK
jgi:RHS repeat-associated protein